MQIAKDFLEKNIYVHEEIGIEEELSGAQLTDIKDGGDTGMTFSIWSVSEKFLEYSYLINNSLKQTLWQFLSLCRLG